jgi:hypothetical protein
VLIGGGGGGGHTAERDWRRQAETAPAAATAPDHRNEWGQLSPLLAFNSGQLNTP